MGAKTFFLELPGIIVKCFLFDVSLFQPGTPLSTAMLPQPELLSQLREAGLVSTPAPEVAPLSGGVSCDIFLVKDGGRRFVVKRALPKLRVKDDWFADVSRNLTEQDWFEYARAIVPESVPRILKSHGTGGWFAMEYLGEEWGNWKTALLAGRAEPAVARMAGDRLGRLHAASWEDSRARDKFSTLRNFTELRISPYLLATARRVPEVREQLEAEAARLAESKWALVHGDYSPKNLLFTPDRLVILDAEVAWFGDPAFDVAFLINHLLIKSLYHWNDPKPFVSLAFEAWDAYSRAGDRLVDADREGRVTRLTLCLMLARVHGKSPVEYLDPAKQSFISYFTTMNLRNPPTTLRDLAAAWLDSLAKWPRP
jgi:aminoglycoside phosphotransferase (APT) family kinase protein